MTEQEAKTKLIQATCQLLDAGVDPDTITVRQIAEQAGVGLGLINYHFGSKDNLMFEAVAVSMREVVAAATQAAGEGLSARERLRSLLQGTTEIGMRHPKLTLIGVRHDLLQGGVGTAQMILPVLREVCGSEVDEISLRLVAFQIIASIQAAFLKLDHLQGYLGIDLQDQQARARLIDRLIDNLIM